MTKMLMLLALLTVSTANRSVTAVLPKVVTIVSPSLAAAISEDGIVRACVESGYGMYIQLSDPKQSMDFHYVSPGQVIRETDKLKFTIACLKVQ